MSDPYYYAEYERQTSKRPPHCNGDASHEVYNNYGVYGGDREAVPVMKQQVVLVEGKRTRTQVVTSTPGQTPPAHTQTNLSNARPILITLALGLLLAVFLLVTGLLVYFNYVTYRPRATPIPEEQCEAGGCPPGAECVVTPGGVVCACRTACPHTSAPVCGTDRNTYPNLCHLRRAACNSSTHIRVQHPGPCKGEKDPCTGVECEYGARCQVTPVGTAECRCPESCPRYGDHAGARPLCATDASDYPDLCSLHRAACTSHSTIQVKYHGKCDPCADMRCGENEVCRVSERRVAQCLCGEACPLELAPVCGSDGKTYPNECLLRKESCATGRQLATIYRGNCDSGLNPCNDVECRGGEQCVIDKSGMASCRCDYHCEPVLRPVCGTDSISYDSECHLALSACLNQTSVKLAYRGVCGKSGGCSKMECQLGAVCVERGGSPTCECPVCSSEFKPVCGSNGVSYGNTCKLTAHACQHHDPDLTLLYQGFCNGCESQKCEHFSVCELDSKGDAICICNQNCTQTDGQSVCGTDGHTYSNDCELKKKACLNKINLRVAFIGNCELCEGVKCQYGARCEAGVCLCPRDCSSSPPEPVCGSDLVTYPSACHLHAAACSNISAQLDLLFYGSCHRKLHHSPPSASLTTPLPGEACADVRCDSGATCEVGDDGSPHCACNIDCTDAQQRPVCASDLRMYPSECAMRAYACDTQAELRLRPLQLCQGLELKPCNGDRPLVGPDGEDLDCGNGHNRQDCPTDYYCHQTPQFAKCCRKDSGGIYLKSCEDSWFGCCPDHKTPATGPDNEGCPSMCGCNKIGSYSDWCDANSGECKCRPGVGGPKCDRCEPGFWGLPKISSGYQGCLACSCSVFGSVRDDCEQMTGRCVCKPGVSGHKCDSCVDPHKSLTPSGCVDSDATTPVPTSCSQLNCYFGAICEERDSRAMCVCTMSCPKQSKMQVVCGNDGQTYGSECQLKLYACKYQMDISVQYYGPCPEEGGNTGTEGPVRRWTSTNQFTLPGDGGLPQSKSTRHLLPDRYPYSLPGRSKDAYVVESGRVTSASVQMLSALGESCSQDAECPVPHSMCFAGLCTCKLGFSQDKEICAEDVPSFTGESWMRFRRMKAYHKFSLDVEVKTYNNEGIIFYTQQRDDGTGDFISLSIVNGYIQLSYNLGSGAVSVSWTEKVKLGTWHKVRVRRYQRDALLMVDNGKAVGAKAGGSSTGLDLGHDAWIGWVDGGVERVWANVGTSRGLVGCIKLGNALGHPLEARGVASCSSNPCSKSPCKNHGHCIADRLNPDSPACICNQHFTGKHCEERISPCVYNVCGLGSSCLPHPGAAAFTCHCPLNQPCSQVSWNEILEFNGKSWLALTRPERVSKAFSIEIWLLTVSNEGNILYSGLRSQHADYISLILTKGRLRFSFSLGDAPAIITSSEVVENGRWYSILVGRVEREGFLQIDNGTVYRNSSGGQLTELNLDTPLYLGALPEEMSDEGFSNIGLRGAVSRVRVNGVGWPGDNGQSSGTTVWSGHPCTPGRCAHNSTCTPHLNRFTCSCLHGFTGPTCTSVIEEDTGDLGLQFDGRTVLRYPKRQWNQQKNNTLTHLNGYNDTVEYDYYYEEELEEDDYYGGYSSNDEYSPSNIFDGDYTHDYEALYDEKGRGRGSRLEISVRSGAWEGGLVVAKGRTFSWGIVVSEGYPTLLVDDSTTIHTLASKVRINDGTWHQVTAVRRRKVVVLQVDEDPPLKIKLQRPPPPTRRFTIGGGWRNKGRSNERGYEAKMNGCLMRVKIDHRPIDLAPLLPEDKQPSFCNDNHLR